MFFVAASSRANRQPSAMFTDRADSVFQRRRGAVTNDRLDHLGKLAALRDAGAHTPAEFDAEKARILSEE